MTEGKNNKSESKEEQPKKKWKLNNEQYIRLIECSNKGPEGIEEWNRRRKENFGEQIWLQKAFLAGTNLQKADLWGANLQGACLNGANLQEANLKDTELQGADLWGADLQEADLFHAELQGTDLCVSNLQGANLKSANLQGVDLRSANLQGADLRYANLQKASLIEADLQGVKLKKADLQGAYLGGTKLQGAKFIGAIVNGFTSFLNCEIDEDTDFRHTGLENTRIESGTKTLLKYNIRRMNWEQWYKQKDESLPELCILGDKLFKQFVRLFWAMSNYGKSTWQIIVTFFSLAFVFAVIYRLWPEFVVFNGKASIDNFQNLWHAFYFSVVTMTTLGFGDIAANPNSWQGQGLLMLQVILGYVLLGALITRFAVLFTVGGPAGSFTPMDKETKELLAKLKEDKGH